MPTSPKLRLSDILGPDSRFFEILALALLASALWLATHPYIGIYHDAIIYSLLAARWIDPSSYVNDVFFIFGSQDDLNLFTPLFGWLVSVLGLDLANRLVTLLGGGLWVGANSLLAYRVFGFCLPFRFVVLAAAATSLSYSPNDATFVLNENFATARSIAMPLAVFGIWADLSMRRWLAAGAFLVATLMHPLLGIWGMLAFICIRVPVAFLLFGICFGVGLLVVNDVHPLSSQLLPMSFEWAEAVRYSSTDVLFGDIASINIERFLWWIGVLWVGAQLNDGMLRRYYLVLALMTACASLLTLYCSYITPVTLLVQIQSWRVLWIAITLGWMALADVVWRGIRLGWSGSIGLGFALIVLYLAGRYAWCVPMTTAIVFGSRFGKCLATRVLEVLVAHRRAAMFLLSGSVLILLPSYLLDLEMLGLGIRGDTLGEWHVLRGWLLGGGLGLSFLFFAWIGGLRWGALIILLGSIPSLSLVLSAWDQRTATEQLTERRFLRGVRETHPFANFVTPGDVIAWPGHELDVWFVLHASNYASSTQAVGIVFSELKTKEVGIRLERLAAASVLSDGSSSDSRTTVALARYRVKMQESGISLDNLHRYTPRDVTLVGGEYLCKDNRLNWFVSRQVTSDEKLSLSVPRYVDAHGTYYLYGCDSFR